MLLQIGEDSEQSTQPVVLKKGSESEPIMKPKKTLFWFAYFCFQPINFMEKVFNQFRCLIQYVLLIDRIQNEIISAINSSSSTFF